MNTEMGWGEQRPQKTWGGILTWGQDFIRTNRPTRSVGGDLRDLIRPIVLGAVS